MDTSKIVEGIIIGVCGGISISLINKLIELIIFKYESRKVLTWLENYTKEKIAKYEISIKKPSQGIPPVLQLWTSTRLIAVYTNLMQDRVTYICSKHQEIIRSETENEVWTIKSIKDGYKSKKKEE
ncbi:MAG: hypothetical protein WCT77_00885 [Bacteroidota bacterium]